MHHPQVQDHPHAACRSAGVAPPGLDSPLAAACLSRQVQSLGGAPAVLLSTTCTSMLGGLPSKWDAQCSAGDTRGSHPLPTT